MNIPSEAWVASYGLLTIKENAQSLESERRTLHIGTVSTWPDGEFQVSY